MKYLYWDSNVKSGSNIWSTQASDVPPKLVAERHANKQAESCALESVIDSKANVAWRHSVVTFRSKSFHQGTYVSKKLTVVSVSIQQGKVSHVGFLNVTLEQGCHPFVGLSRTDPVL
mmetsp:Transcript_3557/g.6792  ORF Transcript_3557/g.6792 Transcript_3557/m.6792 type:complete len:117 (-) Transcript_3557:1716-2066(-)